MSRRLLGAITEVREGEVGTALLLTANVFLLLTAYYVIKPVREALILELDSGAEYKSYASAAIAVLLLVVVPAYARAASKLAHNRLVVGVTLFFASHLVIFYLLDQIESVHALLGVPFYLWLGIFNMMVVAQFWAFANDVYTLEQGKRLFPLVGIGASVGAALGAKIEALLVEPLGIPQLMLVSAALLVLCATLTQVVHRRERGRIRENDEEASDQDPPPGKGGAFAMVFSDRYLTYIAIFTLLFTFANSNGEYVVSALVSEYADSAAAAGELGGLSKGEFIGKFYGDFYFYVNVLGVVAQTFLVSRLVKWWGLAGAMFVLPVIVFASWTTIAFLPVLAVVRVGKTVENAVDYSINNTVRQMLWLPTSPEAKYRAKQAVDTFFVRMGDVAAALLVALLVRVLGWSIAGFAAVNIVLALALIVVARVIVSRNRALTADEDEDVAEA